MLCRALELRCAILRIRAVLRNEFGVCCDVLCRAFELRCAFEICCVVHVPCVVLCFAFELHSGVFQCLHFV